MCDSAGAKKEGIEFVFVGGEVLELRTHLGHVWKWRDRMDHATGQDESSEANEAVEKPGEPARHGRASLGTSLGRTRKLTGCEPHVRQRGGIHGRVLDCALYFFAPAPTCPRTVNVDRSAGT